ncbi:hypothetical protein F8388_016418 [Cannabis sativa]|uniref:Uncharacterized protein n=1 Tax=Cannabis sativa TaxID=3483 RepID=A0A7J6GT88_CANSA|nr:hypothetical protein F8388_016418 [Cannabis sativa]
MIKSNNFMEGVFHKIRRPNLWEVETISIAILNFNEEGLNKNPSLREHPSLSVAAGIIMVNSSSICVVLDMVHYGEYISLVIYAKTECWVNKNSLEEFSERVSELAWGDTKMEQSQTSPVMQDSKVVPRSVKC